MRLPAFCLSLLLLPVWASAAAPEPPVDPAPRGERPHPDCMDARLVERVYATSEWQLAVATSDGQRYRVELGQACPGLTAAGAELKLLAPSGWICGGEGEFVRVDDAEAACPIEAMAPADSREFAALLRESSRTRGVSDETLEAVEVQAPARRRFTRGVDHCFDKRFARAWREDVDGLVVEVSKNRAGGNGSYRVRLQAGCVDLTRFEHITFIAFDKGNVICGNPGDRLQILPENFGPGAVAQNEGPPLTLLGERCEIREVYPLDES